MICLRKFCSIVILVGSLWTDTFGTEAASETCAEEQLLEIFTKWRAGEELSIPLPPLNLIPLPSYEGQYSGYGITISFITGEMKLIGVGDFIVEALKTSITEVFNVSGTMQFPLLTLTSDNYNIKGSAFGLYSLKGSGPMRIAFDNVRVPFSLSLGPKAEGIQIDDFVLDFKLDDVRVDLTNSSWPINRILNAEGVDIIQSYRTDIANLSKKGLKYLLDAYLANVTFTQLISTFIAKCTDVDIS